MDRKYFNFIILFPICFLLSCDDGEPYKLPNMRETDAVAVDDLDLDGAVDIVVTFGFGKAQYLSVLLNDLNFPGSFFKSNRYGLKESVGQTSITLGDLNDDGYSDIAVGRVEDILILFQDSNLPGQFFVPLKIVGGQNLKSLVIGDLNEDGFNDLVFSGNSTHLSILFQDSLNPGNFLPQVDLGIPSTSVAIGDLNGDYIKDMAIIDSGKVKLLFQDPAVPGSFSVMMSLYMGVNPRIVKIEDLDKDGSLDLVVVKNVSNSDFKKGSVSVSLQNPINAGYFLPAVDYSFNCKASKISLGDLNDDGLSDIVILTECSDDIFDDKKIKILFQDITNIGTFLSPVNYSSREYLSSIAIGDMNNDNFNDLILAEENLAIRYQNHVIPGQFLSRIKIFNPN